MGLLKGIDPLLTADLLHVLRSMGHGDNLVVCDCNFPAAEVATKTTSGKCIILTVPLPEALAAICSVLPLDFFVDSPVSCMAPSEGVALPPEGALVINAIKASIRAYAPDVRINPLERLSFYEEARKCYAVVQTLERRPYANVILQKGVIGPDGKDLKPERNTRNESGRPAQRQEQETRTSGAVWAPASTPTSQPKQFTEDWI
jgi:L-fucose mutarotase